MTLPFRDQACLHDNPSGLSDDPCPRTVLPMQGSGGCSVVHVHIRQKDYEELVKYLAL